MNNKVVIGIVAIIVILGVIYFATKGGGNSEVASNTSSQSTAQQESDAGSIKELIAADKDRHCTFTLNEQEGSSAGDIYVGNKKMRGDFTTKVANVETKSHMIYDGATSYVWMDGQSNGFKMALDANQSNTNQSQTVDVNKDFNFDCDSWSPDSSKFELPSGVTFSEMPNFTMPNNVNAAASNSNSVDTKAVQQAVCANLPEPAKTQCLSAL